MKKIFLLLAAVCFSAISSFAQTSEEDTSVFFDKSFLDAGVSAGNTTGYHLVPKFYKAGNLAPEQPIALSTAKKGAMDLVRSNPSPLRRDCINLIYTVDPIYSEGTITGAVKGTILIKWDKNRKMWVFNYLKYQLLNIDQNACVFQYEA